MRFETVIRRLAGVLLYGLFLTEASAAGFDESYIVYQGDINSDQRTDLYIRSTRVISIPLDDIPIVIGPPVQAFVLQNNGDGSFSLISSLSSSQRAAVAQWPVSDVSASTRDIDADGHGDLDLISMSAAAPGARDHIVFGSSVWGTAPRQVFTKSNKYVRFYNDLLGAIYNPNYFQSNVPYRVTSAEPANRVYFGSVIHAGDSVSTFRELGNCSASFGSNRCYLSPVDPAPCVRSVVVKDANGLVVGSGNVDVCPSYVHIFVYVPGTVAVSPDYSVYDEQARESKEILDRLQDDCSLFTPSSDTQRLDQIMAIVYGSPIGIGDGYFPNSTAHPPAPGDELFDRRDPTFHHYDVKTKVCSVGQPNCDLIATNSYSYKGLRAFTYPSYKLQETYTAVDGSPVSVYVPLTGPFQLDNPDAYTMYFGTITQRFVGSGYWKDAVQNVTTPSHTVYPGTIARKMYQEGNFIYVKTHGMGVNKTWCIPEVPFPLPTISAVPAVRMIIAASNDNFGAKTFATLDRQMLKAFRLQNGHPNAQPSGAPVLGSGGQADVGTLTAGSSGNQ